MPNQNLIGDPVDQFVDGLVREVDGMKDPESEVLGRILVQVYDGDLLAFAKGIARAVDADPCHCGKCLNQEELDEKIATWAASLMVQ